MELTESTLGGGDQSMGEEEDWPWDDIRDIYTREEFQWAIEHYVLTDWDGHGVAHNPNTGENDRSTYIVPSEWKLVPESVTHIEWFNK